MKKTPDYEGMTRDPRNPPTQEETRAEAKTAREKNGSAQDAKRE